MGGGGGLARAGLWPGRPTRYAGDAQSDWGHQSTEVGERILLRDTSVQERSPPRPLPVTLSLLHSAYHGQAPHHPPTAGVLVRSVNPTSHAASALRRDDVVMAFDDVAVASDGTVPFRTGERIAFSYLISTKVGAPACVHRREHCLLLPHIHQGLRACMCAPEGILPSATSYPPRWARLHVCTVESIAFSYLTSIKMGAPACVDVHASLGCTWACK